MPHRLNSSPMPASRVPISLLSVDRGVSELRRGRMVAIKGAGGMAAIVRAAEAVTSDGLEEIANLSQSKPLLAITTRRARVLGLLPAQDGQTEENVMMIDCMAGWDAASALDFSDPLSGLALGERDKGKYTVFAAETFGCPTAAIGLAKLSRLLPAVLVAPLQNPDAEALDAWAVRHGMLVVDAGDVFQYEHTSARTLKPVSSAVVPLSNAENTRIIAYRPLDGGLEHLAILIGEPKADNPEPVLVRLHSECFTGDLLGSLRCDCGDQLRGAIDEISKSGGGVLLYLAQEGRGIGLVNKLRAYELQDRGFDTLDANEQLGFDADERVYLPAAEMLRLLGFGTIRLMTNNPEKINALSACGIEVVERVPHAFPANRHNEAYLHTKSSRSGHLL